MVLTAALVACASRVPDAKPLQEGLRLELSLPSPAVREGETTNVALRLTNVSSGQLDACVGEGWTYHVFGSKRDAGVSSEIDHPGCVRRFSLKPGESLKWEKAITIGEVGVGSARLFASVEVTMLQGCDRQYGCYSAHISAPFINIEIGQGRTAEVRP